MLRCSISEIPVQAETEGRIVEYHPQCASKIQGKNENVRQLYKYKCSYCNQATHLFKSSRSRALHTMGTDSNAWAQTLTQCVPTKMFHVFIVNLPFSHGTLMCSESRRNLLILPSGCSSCDTAEQHKGTALWPGDGRDLPPFEADNSFCHLELQCSTNNRFTLKNGSYLSERPIKRTSHIQEQTLI